MAADKRSKRERQQGVADARHEARVEGRECGGGGGCLGGDDGGEKLTRCHGAAQHRQASGTSYSLAARYAFFRTPRSAATSDLVKFPTVCLIRTPTSRSSPRAASHHARLVALPCPSFANAPRSTFRAFFVPPGYSDTYSGGRRQPPRRHSSGEIVKPFARGSLLRQ